MADAQRSHRRCGRTVLAVAALLLVGAVGSTEAGLTAPACLARKLTAWGKLRECQARENAKARRAGPSEVATCRRAFAARLGRVWERKTDDGSVHDKDNRYTWSPTVGAPDGTVFTEFLATLNTAMGGDGMGARGCFADDCTWRLPTIEELVGIVDAGVSGCDDVGSPCIDQTVFGPTIASGYWTTTISSFPEAMLGVNFFDGTVIFETKDLGYYGRAVRSGL